VLRHRRHTFRNSAINSLPFRFLQKILYSAHQLFLAGNSARKLRSCGWPGPSNVLLHVLPTPTVMIAAAQPLLHT
jgi:hypothetical protein